MKEDHIFYAFNFFGENNLHTNLAFTADYLKLNFTPLKGKRGCRRTAHLFFKLGARCDGWSIPGFSCFISNV